MRPHRAGLQQRAIAKRAAEASDQLTVEQSAQLHSLLDQLDDLYWLRRALEEKEHRVLDDLESLLTTLGC